MIKLLYVSGLLGTLWAIGSSFGAEPAAPDRHPVMAKDSVGSVTAYMNVLKVLLSPGA